MENINIFVSYAKNDYKVAEDIIAKIERHPYFEQNGRKYKFCFWWDHHIIPGNQWKSQIIHNIGLCDVVLCMITDSFIESKFINQTELPLAIERYDDEGVPILGFLINDCDFQKSVIRKYELLPKKHRRLKPYKTWRNKEEVISYLHMGLKNCAISSLLKLPIPLRKPRLGESEEYQTAHDKQFLSQREAKVVNYFRGLAKEADRLTIQESRHEAETVKQIATEVEKLREHQLRSYKFLAKYAIIMFILFMLFKLFL